jgi:hypothetical protein
MELDLLLEYVPHTCCGLIVLALYLAAARKGWVPPIRRSRKKGP